MTARIVGHLSREPFSPKYAQAIADGGIQAQRGWARIVPGQLWEREAERDEQFELGLSDHWTDRVFQVWCEAIRREIRSNASTPEGALRIGRGNTLTDLQRQQGARQLQQELFERGL